MLVRKPNTGGPFLNLWAQKSGQDKQTIRVTVPPFNHNIQSAKAVGPFVPRGPSKKLISQLRDLYNLKFVKIAAHTVRICFETVQRH